MQIVIDIPDRIHYGIEKGITVNGSSASQIVIDAVKNGTPLPKGHGRLGDLSEIYVELNEAQIEGTEEYEGLGKAKQIVCDAQTIIESDNAESEKNE